MADVKTSNVMKRTVKNTITQSAEHNRMLEERAMWNIYYQRNSGRSERSGLTTYQRSKVGSTKIRKHSPSPCKPSAAHYSTYYRRQLQKLEEADGDRWAHTGYKELYPDEFDSDRSNEAAESIPSDECVSRKKQKLEQHHEQNDSKVKVKKRKHSRRYVSKESSSSSDTTPDLKRKHKHKKHKLKKKHKHKKKKRMKDR